MRSQGRRQRGSRRPRRALRDVTASIPPRYRAARGDLSGPVPRLLTMSLVTFKDLCIDVNDSRPASEFWARTLGLELTGFDDSPDEFKLVGPTPQHTVWPNVVPEPHEVKNRVHIDVRAASLEPFVGLRRLTKPGQFPWTTFADPEGNEFCVFIVRRAARLEAQVRRGRLRRPVRRSPTGGHGVLGGTVESDDDECTRLSTTSRACRSRASTSCRCPSPRRSRTGSTGTSRSTRASSCRRPRSPPGATVLTAARTTRSVDRHGRPRGQRVLRLPDRVTSAVRRRVVE